MNPSKALLHPLAKPLVFSAALVPMAWLIYAVFAGLLGANPAESMIRSTGDWALRFLCLTLAVTPARELFNIPSLARFRRMAGLFTFFYATVHFSSYAWLDMGLNATDIAVDIAKRPFILVGVLALLLMSPLAATSFNRAIRALGAKRWQILHQLVHVVAALAILHFFWMRSGKNNFAEVAVYATIIVALWGWRVSRKLRGRRA